MNLWKYMGAISFTIRRGHIVNSYLLSYTLVVINEQKHSLRYREINNQPADGLGIAVNWNQIPRDVGAPSCP